MSLTHNKKAVSQFLQAPLDTPSAARCKIHTHCNTLHYLRYLQHIAQA